MDTRRRRTWPTSASTPCSTAGRSRPGIVSTDGDKLRWVREMGHVNDIFTADRLKDLPGFGGHRPRALLDGGRLER